MDYPCDKCEDGIKMCNECVREAQNNMWSTQLDGCTQVNECYSCKCQELEEWEKENG